MSEFYDKISKSCDTLKDVTVPRLELIIKEKRDAKKFLESEKIRFDKHLKELKATADQRMSEYTTCLEKVTKEKSYLFGNLTY